MAKLLLFSRAVPARAPAHLGSAVGQVSRLLPKMLIVPLSLAVNRAAKPTIGAAAAGPATGMTASIKATPPVATNTHTRVMRRIGKACLC